MLCNIAKLRITYNAPVVLTFAIIAVAVQALTQSVWSGLTVDYFATKPWLHSPSDYLSLLSHAIGHANWSHLFGNFTMILLLGPLLEERYGSKELIIMMLITALITSLINLAFFDTILLGASGIVFMMIVLASTTNMRRGEIPLTFVLVAVLFLGNELVDAFGNDQVSQMAHLVGGLAGAVFGFFHSGGNSKPAKPAKPLF